MFVCIDQRSGKYRGGFNTIDEAQRELAELQKAARLKNKICYFTIIEVDDLPDEDEFTIY